MDLLFLAEEHLPLHERESCFARNSSIAGTGQDSLYQTKGGAAASVPSPLTPVSPAGRQGSFLRPAARFCALFCALLIWPMESLYVPGRIVKR